MLILIVFLAPVFFILKHFAELAHEYDRSRWGARIMGLACYGILDRLFFVLGFRIIESQVQVYDVIGIGYNGSIIRTPNAEYEHYLWLVVFGSEVLAGVATIGFYFLLKNYWRKNAVVRNSELLDR